MTNLGPRGNWKARLRARSADEGGGVGGGFAVGAV